MERDGQLLRVWPSVPALHDDVDPDTAAQGRELVAGLTRVDGHGHPSTSMVPSRELA